ncbi:hypothetical protein [Nitrosomonas halophila]|uniref:hypothetical protein n=1 Tax=Nitrosomonas halophila TaxID=44576 RepID=UPI0015A2FEAC|nr:hypothetical protein [Nitrosomonas halophila]
MPRSQTIQPTLNYGGREKIWLHDFQFREWMSLCAAIQPNVYLVLMLRALLGVYPRID